MKAMTAKSTETIRPVWIKGPTLRKRWGNMCASTFYKNLRTGKIPAPEFPFGEATPYWRMDVIEQFEAPKGGAK